MFTAGHAVGDLFVLLDGEGVTRRPLAFDRLGDTLHYRAVGRGGELRDARTEQLTLAGNDLKPYAPAHLVASGSFGADITLSWVRRTRVGGELIDGTGEVPLAEDSEQYDLEILFGNAVVRGVNGLTSPSYVYTSADQATDLPGFVAQALTNPGFEAGAWRQALGKYELSDAALERIRQEGLRVSKPESQQVREWLIQGQLMEEVAISAQLIEQIRTAETERLRQRGIYREVQFFAGDRVRDVGQENAAWKTSGEDHRNELIETIFEELLRRQTEACQLSKTNERLASANNALLHRRPGRRGRRGGPERPDDGSGAVRCQGGAARRREA
jgi:hypothetical protein